jgi:SHR-binding domain of vacuolar-sorting associated protein 13
MEHVQYVASLLVVFKFYISHCLHRSFGCVKVVIYCKYWIVNRTGLPALYKPNTRMFAFENFAAGQRGKY